MGRGIILRWMTGSWIWGKTRLSADWDAGVLQGGENGLWWKWEGKKSYPSLLRWKTGNACRGRWTGKKQENPKYEEMCRRFLADSEDFSEERIAEAKGLTEDSIMVSWGRA